MCVSQAYVHFVFAATHMYALHHVVFCSDLYKRTTSLYSVLQRLIFTQYEPTFCFDGTYQSQCRETSKTRQRA